MGAPGIRRSGDGWVEVADGRRFWGRAGAAGLLAVAPDGAVLLQHRVAWSHFGDTWGVPGGARDLGESALDGALREAREETAIDTSRLVPRFTSVLDLGVWSYTTIAADAPERLPVAVSDAESTALAWVPADDVAALPLHPGFGAAWPLLRSRLAARPALVVDAANVLGSRPDGWWRDRRGATGRLLGRLQALAAQGVPADEGGAAASDRVAPDDAVRRWWPEVVAVLEGEARGAAAVRGVGVIEAAGSGDDELVRQVLARTADARTVWAVTADRALAQRVTEGGGEVRRPGWLLAQLDGLGPDVPPPPVQATG